MKIKSSLMVPLIFGIVVCARAIAMDASGCLQAGDPGYDPKLPCQTPTGPSGTHWSAEELTELNTVAQAINDPNYGVKLAEQWSDALRAKVTHISDDTDMHISLVSPELQPDGTIVVLIGVNTNGRPIPSGVLPATFLGHKTKVFSQPFFKPSVLLHPNPLLDSTTKSQRTE